MSVRIFVADLGMQAISLAEFRPISAGGLNLHCLIQKKVVSHSSLNEFSPLLKTILHNWRKNEKIKEGTKLTIALPSELVLTRFLSLPCARAEEVGEIIGFEAQQNIPFPLNEVVWDYQIIGSSAEGSWRVVLVAAKRAPLAALEKQIIEAGFLVERMDTAPTALYNALRFNYSETQGCVLILDIGFRSMNLIFSEEKNFFIRTIPFGGVLQECKSKNYQVLELLDPSSQQMDVVVQRIHAEMDRSISFYCDQQGGHRPEHLFLAGDVAPTVREILDKKFQIPLNFFNPLRNVTIFSEKCVESQVYTLGKIVGLATHALKNVPIQINLLKSPCKEMRTRQCRRSFLMAASICLILTFFSIWIYVLRVTSLKRDAVENGNIQISALTAQAKRLQELRNQNERLKEELTPLMKAIIERSVWPGLIDALEESLPSKFICVTRLEPTTGNKPILPSPLAQFSRGGISPHQQQITHLLVEGFYVENPHQATVVDHFVNNLSQCSLFIIPDKAKVIRVRDTPDGEHWAHRYTLMLPLRILKN